MPKQPITQAPEDILQFFKHDDIPAHLQAVSKPFCDLAYAIAGDERGMPAGTSTQFPLPRNPERTVALRMLLEAKDAAVRALSAK
jgi:hypothetical protein